MLHAYCWKRVMKSPNTNKNTINPINDPNVGGKNGMIWPCIEKILEVSARGETKS